MDYTQIIQAVIALAAALVTTFVIPWIKSRLSAEKLDTLQVYVEIAVKAAEQIYTAADGEKKKQYVLDYLAGQGITFDAQTVDQMIEATVLELHAALYGGQKK